MNKSNSVPRSRSLSKENDAGEWFDDGKKEAEEEEEDSNRERQERREKAWQLEDEKRESEVKRKESGE